MEVKLYVKTYPQEGDLQHSYSSLKNLLNEDNSITYFDTDELNIDLSKPLNIECQPSYDGTVNLIINDDKNPPRIINSRFAKVEDNRFKIINRNQLEQTNLYKIGNIDSQTRLFRNVTKIPKFSFVELNYFGQLKGGNYTFYIKYADDDFNKTDVVCESGQISIFKGDLYKISSISGTLVDERTDKSIKLLLKNIDTSFSKIYLYYTRETSDLNGFRITETMMLTNPYDITSDNQEIIINGFEEIENISEEELNVQYHYVNNVKTQAQIQNMLFFGNIENVNVDIKNLQNLSYFLEVSLEQKEKSIGWVDSATYTTDVENATSTEYYDPKNIYYNLGYWPDEIYRLGIVYIMNDDSLSPVFSLRGCEFEDLGKTNIEGSTLKYAKEDPVSKKISVNYLDRDVFLNSEIIKLSNTFGVFKNPSQTNSTLIQDYTSKKTRPWFYKINIPKLKIETDGGDREISFISELKKLGVKGFFIVRQKRIPTTLCQGVSLGIDSNSGIPMIYDYDNKKYFTEGFLNKDRKLDEEFIDRKLESTARKGSAIISQELNVSPTLQSMFDGNVFLLQKIYSGKNFYVSGRNHALNTASFDIQVNRTSNCVFVNSDVPSKCVNDYYFSSRAGCAESSKEFSFFGSTSESDKKNRENRNIVRGIYAPYLGVCANLENNAIYNIKISNYSTQYMKDYFNIRKNDNSAFYAISDRFELKEDTSINIYRGDCFTCTTTVRLNRNFIDPDYPINDTIVDSNTWNNNYNGFFDTTLNDKDAESNNKEGEPSGNWAKINRGDLNAVPLGMWVSYKCLSNRNLGLRSEDHSYPDEEALMGNPRSFYPLQDMNTKSNNKIPESCVLNDGYSATVSKKTHISAPNIPYIKDLFDNRIMFSNIQVDGDFKNGYRVFQGLSYEDIDRQYGAIVKLLPWGTNLFCIFEHGLAIIPINEKALMQTTTEQSIHLYGAGVLQKQVSLITPDYGSIWPESVIRTPIGIYGVDTYAKKIWRYNDKNGFETISDMKIQRFLNDNIKLKESDKYPIIALKNVKTHYNNYKGDVMFTFYNFSEGVEWNFCYNERMNQWITKYTWTPLYSENINNVFYSLDKKRSEILAHIYDNNHCTYGIRTNHENEWKMESGDLKATFEIPIELYGVFMASDFKITVDSLRTSYINSNGKEVYINKNSDWIQNNNEPRIKVENTDINLVKKLTWNRDVMESLLKGTDVEYKAPLYYKIDVTVQPIIKTGNTTSLSIHFIKKTVGVVVASDYGKVKIKDDTGNDIIVDKYNELLCNGFYVHGRAGIFDEIDYEDANPDNQIKPTYWYNKQEPFEFEFVVNEPVGLHKIFDDLVIISNKAEPNSIEIEVIGDVYEFKKRGLLENGTVFKDITIKSDPILRQKTLVKEQKCKNIEEYGRRLGNIQYKEDSWYMNIEPIQYKEHEGEYKSARIRDKFAKIRIKYSGEDPVLITAIKTLTTLTTS